MSIAGGIAALFEEALLMLDREAEIELREIGREFLQWLEKIVPLMPFDNWRYEFDRFIAKLARDHVIVAEESCQEWIQWLQEANDAARLDGRQSGTPSPVQFYIWEGKFDPPKVTSNKPAPFDPDYPQLRGSGNAIMEHNPPEQWVELAPFWLDGYRVPQEIKDAFVGWLEDEQRKAAVGVQPAQRKAAAPPELAMADGAEPQPDEQPPPGKGGALAADEGGDLHWIAFERHMENEGVLIYKTIDATGAHWWKVPVRKTMFKGREVYDLRGAVEFEPTFAQSMLLEHDGVVDDEGWEIILRHYLDQFGDGADEQLLKDLASGDMGPAFKKYAYSLSVSLLFGVVLGKSLKRIKKIKSSKVREALDKIKTRLERLFGRKKPDPKKVEKELREITDELRDVAEKSIDAETKKAASEIADEMEAEVKQAAKDVEKLGGPAADAGQPRKPPIRKTGPHSEEGGESKSGKRKPARQRVPAPRTIRERLRELYSRLGKQPPSKTADEAFERVTRTLDEVEDELTQIPKKALPPPPNQPDGRMYPPQPDYTIRHADGSITARTRGHQINISRNGSIRITNRATGKVEFDQLGTGE